MASQRDSHHSFVIIVHSVWALQFDIIMVSQFHNVTAHGFTQLDVIAAW